MPFRMLDYRIRLYRRFPNKRVRQIVIYLRPTSSELVYQTELRLENTQHQFEVIRLWEQPTEVFLTCPGLLPFATLSQSENREQVLQTVAERVEAVTEPRQRSNLAAISRILAGLVLERELVRRLLRQEIMRESTFDQAIVEEGLQEGLQQGLLEGLERGRQEGATGLQIWHAARFPEHPS
jgi:predicted transposase YdaD